MEIANGVFMLNASPHSHVFLILGDENILVDTGVPDAGKKILAEIKSLGADAKTVKKILLTHHDVDHIGNVQYLSEETGAQVFAPEKDIPFITGQRSRPGVKRFVQLFIRPKAPEKIIPYGQKDPGEIKVIPAPGHTPGHVILLYKNVVFAGDLFRVAGGKIVPMSNFMNWDSAMAAKSISVLKSLDFDWACPAHGQPVTEGDMHAFLNNY